VEPFGERIAAIRKECGISQASLGKQTGLGQPRLSRIEKGELAASVQVINKLAAALGRPSRELVAGTDREGHYISQALSPEELAQEEATSEFIRGYPKNVTLTEICRVFIDEMKSDAGNAMGDFVEPKTPPQRTTT
jgi:transcriptional regulator with XRE-family HTH domain